MRAAGLALSLLTTVAHATPPTVAVAPFEDLSGAPGRMAVGEAIRAILVADLKELPGLRVIDRASVDEALDRHDPTAHRDALDPAGAAKIGQLLGATLVCTGSYRASPPGIQLAARVIEVATGAIVASATVEAPDVDLLKLVDRLSSTLLGKAGLGRAAKRLEERPRARVKATTIDSYGQSLLVHDDDEKRRYLRLALDDDNDFRYAATDLAEVEKRMEVRAANAEVVRDQAARDAHTRLLAETNPVRYFALLAQMFSGMTQSRLYRAMKQEARDLIAHPPSLTPQSGLPAPEEVAHLWLVVAESELRELDELLRDGEEFLRRYPGSIYFQTVESQMNTAIHERRKVTEGRAALALKLAEIDPARRNDDCQVGMVHYQLSQWRDARAYLRRCLAAGSTLLPLPRATVRVPLIEIDIQTADWAAARKDLAALEKDDPQQYRSLRTAYELRIPADG